MGEVKWFRVIDPLSPLFGCDVRMGNGGAVHKTPKVWWMIEALRRVDIFVGDRPFQLVAPEGSNLGLAIDPDQLEESPLQDDTVELRTDRPYDLCLDESEMTRGDGYTLRIARYEKAVQVALDDPQEVLLGTRTFYGGPDEVTPDGKTLFEIFESNGDPDEIVAILKRSN